VTRTRAERLAIDRDGPTCRRCGRDLTDFPASVHHRQPKGSGGGSAARYDRVENEVVVCGTGTTLCHGWIHGHPKPAYATGWLVHRWDDPGTVPLVPLTGSHFTLTEEAEVIYLPTIPNFYPADPADWVPPWKAS
jgi:hypothetical protein